MKWTSHAHWPISVILAGTAAASLLPVFVVSAFSDGLDRTMGEAHYVLFHNIAEFFSITVSLSIFGLGWCACDQSKDRSALFLSIVFLTTGLLDFMHVMSNAGMPPFITSNSPNKSAQFWIIARLFSASALLASASVSAGRRGWWLTKPVLLTAGLGIVTLTFAAVIFFPDFVPDAYVYGVGQTQFKKISEYIVIILFAVTAMAYINRIKTTEDSHIIYYPVAFIICCSGEVAFAVYTNPADTYNVIGHIYKVAAFYMIYRGSFVSYVAEPHRTLARTLDELEAEQVRSRLAAIVESSQDAIIGKSLDGVVTSWNSAAETLFGFTAVEMVGRSVLLVIPPEGRREEAEIMARVRRGETVTHYETERRRKNGSIIAMSITMSPVRDSAGTIVGVSSVGRDITRRKRNEAALTEAKAVAERANEAKSRFLAAASHDLRQPLQALSLYHAALATRVTEAEAPLMQQMELCLGSLNELLTDLLDLSKLDAGVTRARPVDFAVADVLGRAMANHAGAARAKGIDLRMVMSSLTARTDAVLFERIVGNLVSNAVRYTGRGGVVLGCRRRGARLWVEVWDSGIGIPADKTGEIFEEFHQLGNHERNREKGTGLGLAIVRKTANLLGLEIRVASRPGHGSMFAVELPPGQVQTVAERPVTLPAGRVLRVALVEDDANVRHALTCALESCGHGVVAAAALPDLLAGLGDCAPDVMIADFRLGGQQTGIDAVTAVRRLFGATVQAVILTGDTDPRIVRDIHAKGFRVQHKPLSLESLKACLCDLAEFRQGPGGEPGP
jgi:PAS domain S-box-containing protein